MIPDGNLQTTAGNLHVKRVDHLSLQWVIQNYFKDDDKRAYKRFASPEFLFGGCLWRLLMYPNYDRSQNISESEIYLERLDIDIERHDVSFTVGIIYPDGSVYKSKKCTSSMDAKLKTASFVPKVIKLDAQSELFTEGQGPLTVFIEDLVLHKRIMEEQSATPTGEVIFNEKNEICKQDDDAADDQAVDDTDSHEGTYLFANSMKMSLNQDGCDVLFKGEDGFEIRILRTVLETRFPTFASLFRDDPEFKNTAGVVIINERRGEIFKDFLQYIYSEPMSKVNSDDVCALYESSVKHKLKHLEKKSIEFIKKDMSVDTMFEILAIAIKHKVEIVNCATDYFALHMQSILPTMTWKKFIKDNHIVANDLIIKALKKNCVIFNSIAENKLPKEQ